MVDVLLVDSDGRQQQRYSVEELFAMILKYLRDLASKTPGEESVFVRDCVIAVPPYFSPQQRQGILDAAQLAGLNVLSLMHDTTAAMLQYGVNRYKMFLEMQEDAKPHNVLVFDMGALATKVSVAQFRGPANTHASKSAKSRFRRASGLGRIDIKSVAWDQMIGGHDFDACLANHFASVFEKQHPGKDVRSKPRMMARILQQSQKVKEILSANTETFFVIESLIDDIDFRTKITRDEFHSLCGKIFDRIATPVRNAIQSSGIALEDFDSIELIGGSSRIPYVQQILEETVKRNLSYSLNSDEAIALGATFRGANLSPYFQSKSFTLTDITPYRIDFVLSKSRKQLEQSASSTSAEKSGKAMTLFAVGDPIMTKKTINIPRTEDFTITLRFSGSNGVPAIPISYAANGDIEIIKVMGVEQAMDNFTRILEENKESTETGAKTKVRVAFELDNNGLIALKSAQATLERIVRVKIEESGNDNNKTQNVHNGNLTDGEQNKTISESEVKFKKQKMFSRVDLHVGRQLLAPVHSQSPEMLKKANDLLRAMDDYDAKKSEMARQRNSLESMIYTVHYQFLEDDDIEPFYNEQQKQELLDLLVTLDSWLENEDTTTENSVEWFEKRTAEYMEKSASISKLVRPIQSRFDAKKQRDREFANCEKLITGTKALLTVFEQTAEHITAEEREELSKMIDSTRQFIEQKQAEQEKSPPYEPPVISPTDIRLECSKLSEKSLELSRKPKPVVVQEEPPKSETTDKENNSTSDSSTNTTVSTDEEVPTTEQQTVEQEHQKDEL